MATWLNLFFNDRKTEEDNLPMYKHNKLLIEDTVTLEAGKYYEVALWKKTKNAKGEPVNMVSIKIEESDYWNNQQPQVEQLSNKDEIDF